jgi:hypothetical protein
MDIEEVLDSWFEDDNEISKCGEELPTVMYRR